MDKNGLKIHGMKFQGERGFIGKLVLIVIALAALKYFFDWSIIDALESERGQAAVDYLKNIFLTIWSYLFNLKNS